ncbi:CinA family protein [Phaeobacter piscinae]|uniref:CinA family protein n=1 Tax=Phaeobacter piscinae TaxID=1580596 RepID=UPI000BBEE2AA|nr:CinA family protein [Phaeobacter piscinae]ATG39484.1 competence/damage-inducible protein CinA [Phaeobacter piscinae]
MDTTDIIREARAKGLTLATAESCTAGMITAALTDVAGSSAVVDRGYVTYSNRAKQEMLGVEQATLEAVGAVSEEVAIEMAEGAQSRADVDIAVAVTGIAGPGGSEHKPEGRVCFALARRNQPTHVETIDFGPLGRDGVRIATRDHALTLIWQSLTADPLG